MRRQQKPAEQPQALTQVRVNAGMTPGGNHRTWSKRFLNNEDDALTKRGLPVADVERWPKREPQYEEIKKKFPQFTWRAIEGKDKYGRHRKYVVHEGAPTVGGILPTLADLLLMDPSIADAKQEQKQSPVGVFTTIGEHSMNVSNESVRISADVVRCLEEALNTHTASATTARIVRLDMAPMRVACALGKLPIYEVETSPGISLALRLNPEIREPLIELIDAAVLPEKYAAAWTPAYQIFTDLGVPLHTSWGSVPANATSVYVSCEGGVAPADMRSRLATDPWGKKDIDFPISGGRYLWNFDHFEELKAEFPNGFVVKPLDGWGADEVKIYAPNDRRHSHTRAAIEAVMNDLTTAMTHVVQPFYKPYDHVRYGTTIWRVIAIRNSLNSPFRLIGGMWNGRTSHSLIVHGAQDAVFGPLQV